MFSVCFAVFAIAAFICFSESSALVTAPLCFFFFFLMIRRPPRSTLDRSSAASDVYKRQLRGRSRSVCDAFRLREWPHRRIPQAWGRRVDSWSVSYTHLRAHETVLDLVCRLLLEKKTTITISSTLSESHNTHHVTRPSTTS